MSLPGNYAIGYLEEDNPQKAYFRFKPLFVLENGVYTAFSDSRELFKDDGFIRIVPDKNESSRFKARMRQLGRYCALDLRQHAGENDKIRPNKNYAPERQESNAYIVYSDVICQAAANQLIEIIPEGGTALTEYAFIEKDGQLTGPYPQATEAEAEPVCPEPREAPEEARIADILFLDGSAARVAVSRTEEGFFPPIHAEAPAEEEPAEEEIAKGESPEEEPAREEAPPAFAPPEPDYPLQTAPEEALMQSEAAEELTPPEEKPARKPWLEATAPKARPISVLVRPGDALSTQTGLNPRRGRSLNEVVDDQWRRSRLDQLGHPVPPNVHAIPLENTMDSAMRAIKEVWRRESARDALVEELVSLNGFAAAAASRLDVKNGAQADNIACELEATRLKLTVEIDSLKKQRQQIRADIYEEMKASRAEEIKRLEGVREVAKEEARKEEEIARKAREAAAKAENELTEIQARRLWGARVQRPETVDLTAGELISRVRTHFSRNGVALDNDQTVNLLGAMCAGPVTILSGPAGSGKSATVRLLAEALGLGDRFVELPPKAGDAVDEDEFKALNYGRDMLTPRLLLLDDANAATGDTLRGLGFLGEASRACVHPALKVFATIQDGGVMVDARVFDRAFTIRLAPTPEEAEPRPRQRAAAEKEAVSLESIERAFAPVSEIPAEIVLRLKEFQVKLKDAGAFLTRRALDGIWEYCARTLKYLDDEPKSILDLALSQRALPMLLASAQMKTLAALPDICRDYPRCLKLMDEPLPLPPL